MNHGEIAGHLGADPEVRFTSTGQKVTTLRVAARCRKKEDTIWWKVSVWGEQYDKMITFLKKGSPIIVRGYINKPEIFNDKEGKPQPSMSLTATSLDFSPFGRPEGSGQGSGQSSAHSGSQIQEQSYAAEQTAAVGQGKEMQFSDEEVPF